MIKIRNFGGEACQVDFELEPTRHYKIYEYELGREMAARLSNYYVTKDGEIYKSVDVDIHHPLTKLKEMHEELREEFSEKISAYRKKVDEFRFLQRITENKKV